MCNRPMRSLSVFSTVVLVGAGLVTVSFAAQTQNPLQAIKDAWKKSRQQQQQQGQKQTQQQPSVLL